MFIITAQIIDPEEEENNCAAKNKQAKFPYRPLTNGVLDLWSFEVKPVCGIPAGLRTHFQMQQASRHLKWDKKHTYIWNRPCQHYPHFIANPPK